jgi:Family of unknown function (DUF5362)
MEDQQIPPATNQLENFFNISFDEATRAQIKQAAVWAKVITLCAFAGYAVVLVVAIFGQPAYPDDSEGVVTLARTSSIIGIILSVGLGVLVNYFLYRFAVATAKGMDNMDNLKTNEGFNALRRYFKICGILIIIALSFVVLGIVVGIIAGLGRS